MGHFRDGMGHEMSQISHVGHRDIRACYWRSIGGIMAYGDKRFRGRADFPIFAKNGTFWDMAMLHGGMLQDLLQNVASTGGSATREMSRKRYILSDRTLFSALKTPIEVSGITFGATTAAPISAAPPQLMRSTLSASIPAARSLAALALGWVCGEATDRFLAHSMAVFCAFSENQQLQPRS